MRWFILGMGMVHGALTAWALTHLPSGYDILVRAKIGTALLLVVLPLAAGTIAAQSLNLIEPRRHLAREAGARLVPLSAGIASATASIALAAVALAYISGPVTERIVMIVSAFLCAHFTVRFMPISLPGHCRRCAYDLSGATVVDAGRCPECGLTPWVDSPRGTQPRSSPASPAHR